MGKRFVGPPLESLVKCRSVTQTEAKVEGSVQEVDGEGVSSAWVERMD